MGAWSLVSHGARHSAYPPCRVGKAARLVAAWRGALELHSALSLDRLAPPARALLDRAAAIALTHGAAPYLVGGSVRDLLLGRTTIDLDVTIVGDAIGVARALHEALGGAAAARLRVHEAFGTATVIPNQGPPLDLITARRERYPLPGALPVVTPGTLDDDLRRRDFTINAIGLPLDPAAGGYPYDPLGGRADLDAGIVRTLYADSFRDDPTRLLRAARYADRLGFAFDQGTAAQFAAAITARVLDTISIQRLSHEFVRLLAEERAAAMLDRLAAAGALAQFAPALRWGVPERAAFARLDSLRGALLASVPVVSVAPLWELRFAVLVAARAPEAARAAATGLALPGRGVALAEQAATLVASLAAEPLPDADAALGRRLDGYAAAALVVACAITDVQRERNLLLRYLLVVRDVRPLLDGMALRALGVAPGPIYREALAALRDFKRDHPATDADDELVFLRGWLAAGG
jgi:tRNA nucleotidyltransferase (CCA-adding enzyme)